MKAKLISVLVGLILELFTPELLKKFADMLLDFVENHVLESKSTVDDRIILPLCGQIRGAFDIPDED